MSMDNSIASFWHSYTSSEKGNKLLTGGSVTQAAGAQVGVDLVSETLDNTLLEVSDAQQ
jgi:hypothetical protein